MRLCDDGDPVSVARSRPAQLLRDDRHARCASRRRSVTTRRSRSSTTPTSSIGPNPPATSATSAAASSARPNNFDYDQPLGDEGTMRVTALANYDRWLALGEPSTAWKSTAGTTASSSRPCGSCPTSAPGDRHRHVHPRRRSSASPGTTTARCTVHRTSNSTARTHLDNLFICGTDQGFVGIVGAIISGISMANMHCLKE